ncbi:MAG: hypothetical protein JEZ07_15810 [Phycisphaerae bacterium]|nr:hypothetical protein [Phycisphaerae bacterium]
MNTIAKKKSCKRILWFSLSAILVLLLISAIPLKRTLDKRKVNKRIAELRELGYPMSAKEVNDAYQALMPIDNGAHLILAAAEIDDGWKDKNHPRHLDSHYNIINPPKEDDTKTDAFLKMEGMAELKMALDAFGDSSTYPDDWKIQNFKLLPYIGDMGDDYFVKHDLSKEQLKFCRDYIKENTECFELLSKGLAKKCFYEVDYSQGYFTEETFLAPIRKLSKKLTLKVLVESYNNNIDLAINDIDNIFKLAQTLNHQPTLIGQCVRNAIGRLGCTSVENLINICEPNDIQLNKLQNILSDTSNDIPNINVALNGERACGLDAMNDKQLIHKWHDGANWKLSVYQALYMYNDQIRYINAFQQLVEDNSLDGFDYLNNLPRIKTIYSGLITPALGRAFVLRARCETMTEYAITALAVERYRLANSKLPETLQELVDNNYITNIPKQPCSDKDCGYTINSSTSYEIYHFGDNKKDDGGIYDYKDRNNPDDQGIRIKR